MKDKQTVDPETTEHEVEPDEVTVFPAELIVLCSMKTWNPEDAMQITKGLAPSKERYPDGKIKLSLDCFGDALCDKNHFHEPSSPLSFEEGVAAHARHMESEKKRKQALSRGEVYIPSPPSIGSVEEKMAMYALARQQAHKRTQSKRDLIENEITEMLEHWAGSGAPSVATPLDFISWAFKNGYGIPWSEDTEFNTWASNDEFEVPWLDLSKTHAPPAKRKAAYQAHQENILQTIVDLGFDPKNIPKVQQGKAGVRAIVKKRLVADRGLMGEKSFKNEWQNLRDNGEIVDSDSF